MTYATFSNTNSSPHIAISTDGLTITGTAGPAMAFTNIPANVGTKTYWEMTSNTNHGGVLRTGIGSDLTVFLSASIGGVPSQWALQSLANPTSQVVNNLIDIVNGYAEETFNAGDVIGIALNLVENTVQFFKNDMACGTPVTVTGGVNYYPASSVNTGMSFTANFGATPFKYPVPTGFQAGLYQ